MVQQVGKRRQRHQMLVEAASAIFGCLEQPWMLIPNIFEERVTVLQPHGLGRYRLI